MRCTMGPDMFNRMGRDAEMGGYEGRPYALRQCLIRGGLRTVCLRTDFYESGLFDLACCVRIGRLTVGCELPKSGQVDHLPPFAAFSGVSNFINPLSIRIFFANNSSFSSSS